MTEIRTLAKPEIYLIGNSISGGNQNTGEIFSGIVDHSKSGTTSITSPTQLNKEDILTFQESVRIIITGQLTPKPTYTRRSGAFSSTEFEGKQRENTIAVNQYAETFYTLNGKDPVRNSNYLYNYTDRDDVIEEDHTETTFPITTIIGGTNPSDPSFIGSSLTEITNPSTPGETTETDNLNTLGFILKNVNSGSNLITLKARTFFQGGRSAVAVAYFKIYNSPIYTTTIDNADNNS